MTTNKFGRQTPTQSVILPYKKTRGAEAVELYNKGSHKMLEWQEALLYDIMAINDDDLWVHQKFGYSIPRRNGKSEMILALCLWALKEGIRVLYTAHRTTTSHAVWERLERMCEPAGVNVISSFKAFGKEHLYTDTEGVIEFRTRTSSGGLGEGYDLLIIDEAQEYTEAQETSLKYIVSDSDNPMTVMLGTPPTVVSSGTVFVKYRDTVLEGRGYDSGWAEWSVDEMHDVNEIEAWYDTNPSLGIVLTERKIRAEITNDDTDFNIQRLGLWLRYNQKSAISKAEWEQLKVEKLPRLKGKLFVGIKYSQKGDNVSMSIAVKTIEGKVFVECIDCRPIKGGNDWIINFLLRAEYAKVVVDGAVGQELLAVNIKDVGLKSPVLPTVKQIITFNSDFEQGFYQGNIIHMNQPSLTQSVTNCEKRAIGSNGGFGYKSNKEDSDISLMESMVLAYAACSESKEKKKQRISY